MFDSNNGPCGGVVCTYSGACRRHPWPSRDGEYVMDGSGTAAMLNGDVYSGEFKLGMFSGSGKMVHASGDIYDGEWEGHMKNGNGVLDAADGTCYVGLFHDGEKEGGGNETSAAGDVFSGVFRNGQKEGRGRSLIKASGTVIDGYYQVGVLHGKATITYGQGDVFVGSFVHGKADGKGWYTENDTQDAYEELFECGKCIVGVLEDNEDPVGQFCSSAKGEKLPPMKGTPSSRCIGVPQQTAVKVSDREEEKCMVVATLPELQSKAADDDDTDFFAKITKRVAAGVEAVREREKKCMVAYHSTGDRYEGGWMRLDPPGSGNRRGLRHGIGKMTYASSGIVYEGPFENNLREGFGVEAHPSSGSSESDAAVVVRFEGFFHNDLYDGKATVHYSDGTTVEEFYSKGLRNGISHCHPTVQRRFRGEVRSAMFDWGADKALDYHSRVTSLSY